MDIRKRILVVDDEPTVRESCKKVFAERGYEVETVSTGKEGLERARCGYYDCALVDLKIPDVDGMEIVRHARETRGNMPVVIITGYGTTQTAAEATRLGVSDYVSKPFTPEEIVGAVDRAMDGPPRPSPSEGLSHLAKEIQQAAPRPEFFENRPPPAVAQTAATAFGAKRATSPIANWLILGVLAGAYIGFGAQMATLVGCDAASKVGFGIGQALCGAVFSVGLMLVVLGGAELFTGNNLMVMGVMQKQFGVRRLLAHWGVVYLANFAGSIMLAYIMYESGLWKSGGGAVGAKALAIAGAKTSLPFEEAFFRGIGCNWLVCLAVWMSLSSREVAGKVLTILFPIMAFVALGYEHCVANMYFIPLGLFLKSTAVAASVPPAALDTISWENFAIANLLPVTLGNIVGGAAFVGSLYGYVYLRTQAKASETT